MYLLVFSGLLTSVLSSLARSHVFTWGQRLFPNHHQVVMDSDSVPLRYSSWPWPFGTSRFCPTWKAQYRGGLGIWASLAWFLRTSTPTGVSNRRHTTLVLSLIGDTISDVSVIHVEKLFRCFCQKNYLSYDKLRSSLIIVEKRSRDVRTGVFYL